MVSLPVGRSAGRGSTVVERGLDEVDRRTVVWGALVVAAAVAGGVVGRGTAAGLGRAVGGAKSPGSQSVSLAPPRPHASGASAAGADDDCSDAVDSEHDGTGGDSYWPGQPGAGWGGCEFHGSEDR